MLYMDETSSLAAPGPDQTCDLLVIGGGINGCGIARDAAGRGLKVLLVEQDDLASATSQWSSKLIHGGLRYLEYYEFRLVAESLAEREVLLRAAPHLIQPLEFVIPHEPHLRPRWMIRAGLFLYDRLGGKKSVPASKSVDLSGLPYGAGLKPAYTKGFSYFDARADDARLTILNARGAADLGAVIQTRTRFAGARVVDGVWRATLEPTAAYGARQSAALQAPHQAREVRARSIVNAAGPWVMRVLGGIHGVKPSSERVKHVKGSHIVVPRVHAGEHAYLLQNRDKRIVFVIPYQDEYSLIGTTDIPVEAWDKPAISNDELNYLCSIASEYLAKPVTPAEVVWTYSGVRPLYDDGQANASAITRDYTLKLDHSAGAPLLNIFGGKLTTFRKLSEHALTKLQPYFPALGVAWTHEKPLPGGDFSGGLTQIAASLKAAFPFLPDQHANKISRRHGTLASAWLGGAKNIEDLGEHFGAGLYAAEVDHMIASEWAQTAEDVLMRRSKCGLGMTAAQKARVATYIGGASYGTRDGARDGARGGE